MKPVRRCAKPPYAKSTLDAKKIASAAGIRQRHMKKSGKQD